MRGLTADEYAILLELIAGGPPRQILPQEEPIAATMFEHGRLIRNDWPPGYGVSMQGVEAARLWPAVAAAMTGGS